VNKMPKVGNNNLVTLNISVHPEKKKYAATLD
jgi:hypothetical protein